MKSNNYSDIEEFINLIGGKTRFLLATIINKFSRRDKPKKETFILGPDISEDYLGHTSNTFKNIITSIIIFFILMSLIIKFLKTL